jgi:hypothetical protein
VREREEKKKKKKKKEEDKQYVNATIISVYLMLAKCQSKSMASTS